MLYKMLVQSKCIMINFMEVVLKVIIQAFLKYLVLRGRINKRPILVLTSQGRMGQG